MVNPVHIGAIIREKREAKGLSQLDLARAVGMKQQSLDAVEKGRTARSRFLPEIAAELGIEPESVGLPKEQVSESTVLPARAILSRDQAAMKAALENGGIAFVDDDGRLGIAAQQVM